MAKIREISLFILTASLLLCGLTAMLVEVEVKDNNYIKLILVKLIGFLSVLVGGTIYKRNYEQSSYCTSVYIIDHDIEGY